MKTSYFALIKFSVERRIAFALEKDGAILIKGKYPTIFWGRISYLLILDYFQGIFPNINFPLTS